MHFDILFIGGGMALSGAHRARELGLQTGVIERDGLGGAHVQNSGAAILALRRSADVFHLTARAADYGVRTARPVLDYESVQKRRESIRAGLSVDLENSLTQNGITLLRGEGSLLGNGSVRVRIEGEPDQTHSAGAIVLATGSRPRTLNDLLADGSLILTHENAVQLPAAPESVIIVGAGPTGCELASFFASMGSGVTLLEKEPLALPAMDAAVAKEYLTRLQLAGVHFESRAHPVSHRRVAEGIELEFVQDGRRHSITAEKAIVAAGRVPNSDKLGLAKADIAIDDEGYIIVDADLQTATRGVFACGDVRRGAGLANAAAYEAVWLAEKIAGCEPKARIETHPLSLNANPAAAWVGMTEAAARDKFGSTVEVRMITIGAGARGRIYSENAGAGRLVFGNGALVGAHLAGPGAGELIATLSLAVVARAGERELRTAIFPPLGPSAIAWEGSPSPARR